MPSVGDPLDAPPAERYATLLEQVVDRLRTMPLARIDAARPVQAELAERLLALTARLGDPAPTGLPTLRDQALGDVIAVLGHDARTAADGDEQAMAEAIAALMDAKRALP